MDDFVFGPNGSFYGRAFGKTYWHNLPTALHEMMQIPGQAKLVYNLALGEGSTCFVAYKDVKTGKNMAYRRSLPEKLWDWLYRRGKEGKAYVTRDIPTLKVVLGPKDSFFACDKNACYWDELPLGLEDFIESEIEKRGNCRPEFLCLGARGAYIIRCGGKMNWFVSRAHPKLKALLDTEYAKDTGQSGYRIEGDIQLIFLDPFTVPAQVIICELEGCLYDTPTIMQDNTSRRIIEEFMQHIRTSRRAKKQIEQKNMAKLRQQSEDLRRLQKDLKEIEANDSEIRRLSKQLEQMKVGRKRRQSQVAESETPTVSGFSTASSPPAAAPLEQSLAVSIPMSWSGYPISPYSGAYDPSSPPPISSPAVDPWYNAREGMLKAQQDAWYHHMQTMYGPGGWATPQQQAAMQQLWSMYGPGSSMSASLSSMSPDAVISSMSSSTGMSPGHVMALFGGVNPFDLWQTGNQHGMEQASPIFWGQ